MLCTRSKLWISLFLLSVGADCPGVIISMNYGQETIPFPSTNGVAPVDDADKALRVDPPHSLQHRLRKRVILDTDMGNDIDDALALAMLHALMQQGECQLLGVAVTKDNAFAAQFVDVVNTFYGNGNLPIGTVENGVTIEDGKFTRPVVESAHDGQRHYRMSNVSGYERAVPMLRRLLTDQPDHSVIPIMIGFSTNMAQLLDSTGDDISPLSGRDLIATKVSHFVAMAGNFSAKVQAASTLDNREYNVYSDIPSAQKFFGECPVPVLFCGFEIGSELKFPAQCLVTDFTWTERHPVVEAYYKYKPMPYDRPSWDQATVLAAVRPEHKYYKESQPGTVEIDELGNTRFRQHADGSHKFLILPPENQRQVLRDIVKLCARPIATPTRSAVTAPN